LITAHTQRHSPVISEYQHAKPLNEQHLTWLLSYMYSLGFSTFLITQDYVIPYLDR
jgi:hypothetical protein